MNHNTSPSDESALAAIVRDWHKEVSASIRKDEKRARLVKQRVMAAGGEITGDPTLNYLAGRIEAGSLAVNALAARLHAEMLDPAQFLATPSVDGDE